MANQPLTLLTGLNQPSIIGDENERICYTLADQRPEEVTNHVIVKEVILGISGVVMFAFQ